MSYHLNVFEEREMQEGAKAEEGKPISSAD